MFLTVEEFAQRIGMEETLQIAGVGGRETRSLDTAKIAADLAAAEGLIVGYVRARFPAAVEYPPDLLKGFCADIARWRLRGRGGQQSAMADVVKERYEAALAALRDIAAGRLLIEGGDAAVAANAGANARILGSFAEPVGPRLLEGFR